MCIRDRFFSVTSIFWRVTQYLVLIAPFNLKLGILSAALGGARNLLGDFRDVENDRKDKMFTIPILLGLKKNHKWAFYVHLGFVIATTILWFSYTQLNIAILIAVVALQIITYPLTPRESNPKFLRKIYKN